MGTFGSGERYDDNPFVFKESSEYVINPQSQQDMPNPLRAMYEDLAPLLIRSPPSKRYPQQPTGRKGWDVLTDPISELILTSKGAPMQAAKTRDQCKSILSKNKHFVKKKMENYEKILHLCERKTTTRCASQNSQFLLPKNVEA